MPSPESAFGGTTWRVAIGDRFEKAGSTRRGCPAAIAVQEKPFLDALNRVATHGSIGEFLELLDESGIVLIRLRRAGVSPDGSQFADPTATTALAAHDFVCSRGADTAIFHEDVFKVKVFKG